MSELEVNRVYHSDEQNLPDEIKHSLQQSNEIYDRLSAVLSDYDVDAVLSTLSTMFVNLTAHSVPKEAHASIIEMMLRNIAVMLDVSTTADSETEKESDPVSRELQMFLMMCSHFLGRYDTRHRFGFVAGILASAAQNCDSSPHAKFLLAEAINTLTPYCTPEGECP